MRKTLVLISLTALCAAGAALAWLYWRPAVYGYFRPPEIKEQLFQGITYQRILRRSPRPLAIHIVKVTLKQDGISFLVTPGDVQADLPLKARTTTQFLQGANLQVAINGDGFTPWYFHSLLDYYPHAGDPVRPAGLAASRGAVYSPLAPDLPVLYISKSNQAAFNTPIGAVFNAISGNTMLVEQGKPVPGLNQALQPRTAVALDKAGKYLIIVVVDGRQFNYSEGVGLGELAEIIINQGGYTAMNLDGGGSTTLVAAGKNGRPRVLNSPMDLQMPGRQRPVGNHLGIYARQ